MMKPLFGLVTTLLCVSPALAQTTRIEASQSAPLTVGQTFTIQSQVLGEVRRINVYAATGYADTTGLRLPVLYMPDGGIGEDFQHVAGLLQVSVMNGTMRPFLLVGIENTQRRRDLTGPTENPEDRKIAATVGGSANFRQFIRSELMPVVNERYRTTDETAIVGESLAGLFIVETFFLEPDLFDAYIAFDPSLWWNNGHLVNGASDRLKSGALKGKTIYLASSSEPELAELAGRLAAALKANSSAGVKWQYQPMPAETHATIYHPAALAAFRSVFRPFGPDDLSVVDLYGVRTVSAQAVREAVGLERGDQKPTSTDALRARLRAIPGIADAEVSTVCCADDGGSILYVGIRETNTRPNTFRAAPTGQVRLPEDVIALGARFEAALIDAVKRGVAGESNENGYAFNEDSTLRAVQTEFLSVASQRFATLRTVLRTSSDPEHRALAAQIIAYAPDRKAVIDELVRSVTDPNAEVRNNATRAIGVAADWLGKHPEVTVRIPADPFIAMLNSLSWSDRNKAALALMSLTASKDPRLLAELRSRALPSLLEMARWTNPGHALGPYMILARVVGVDEGEAFNAWQTGNRDLVINRAVR